jgi:hypothetical protein
VNDSELVEAMERRASVPYPGSWHAPPFPERTIGGQVFALVAVDPGLSAIGVNLADGSVWLLPEDDEPGLVNASVDAFVACSALYSEAAAEAAEFEADGSDLDSDDDEGDRGDAFTDALISRFEAVDEAVADENALWPVAAEELGYSIPL